MQAQRSSTSSNSRRKDFVLAPASTSARERRKSLQRLHGQDQVQVEVEIVQQGPLRHQLTSDGEDTLNQRVPSLERDEEAAREEVSTVFENHRKSLIQHCERSELRLHFEWTKVH